MESNVPTTPYGYGRQNTIVPSILNDLNLPCNPFNMLATMEVMQAEPTTHDKHHTPQSPEPSELSPISTASMNRSTIDIWKTSHATRDDNTFHSEDEPRKIYVSLNGTCQLDEEPRGILLEQCSPFTLPTPKQKRKLSMWISLQKRRGSVAACLRGMRASSSNKKGHPRSFQKLNLDSINNKVLSLLFSCIFMYYRFNFKLASCN